MVDRFEDPEVRKSIEVDLAMIDSLNQILKKLEWHIEKTARHHDYHTLYLLRSIPGVGKILALVILYEIHDASRFPRVQDFSSYARLIRPVKESDGKWAGHSNKKIGNHHLKWAIKEAAIMMLRESLQAKNFVAKYTRKYNKGKALGIFTHKLGRAIYFMLKNKEAFDMKRFFAQWFWNWEVPAGCITETIRVDLNLSIYYMQLDCEKYRYSPVTPMISVLPMFLQKGKHLHPYTANIADHLVELASYQLPYIPF